MSYDAERQRKRRRKRIAKGLCVHCGEPPEKDRRLCFKHLEQQRIAQSRAYYKRRAKEGAA